MKQPTPAFLISIDGRDLTSKIDPRFVSLSIRETRGEDSDSLDLTLDDGDGLLAIPSRGAIISASIGWQGATLVHKGKFIVDEVEHSGAPDQITLRARSASLTKGLGERREQSWHAQTIGAILKTIAGRNKLSARVGAELEKILIAHIDQTNESDMSFLTRLAKRYDAVLNVKDLNLLFMPIGQGASVSGRPLEPLHIERRDGDRHRYHIAERGSYEGVRAMYHSNGKAKRESVIVGGENNQNMKVLPETYPTKEEATRAATSEYNRIKRGQATFGLTLAFGMPDIYPERPAYAYGWKKEIDETDWLVREVTHDISDSGYTNSVDFEMRDDPASDQRRSRRK